MPIRYSLVRYEDLHCSVRGQSHTTATKDTKKKRDKLGFSSESVVTVVDLVRGLRNTFLSAVKIDKAYSKTKPARNR